MADHTQNNENQAPHSHHHHILPDKVALGVGATLLILTGITVAVSQVDLGAWNLPVALLVACTKALLVCLFFMNLLYDRKENAVIFATSFFFLIVFITLTGADLFFRGDVYVKKGEPLFKTASGAAGKPKFKKPWVATAEITAHGKEIFNVQCATCHGANGEGNGPASGALNPKPRNFHAAASEWKNGRKITQIFGTLTNGLGGMPSFSSLTPEDRWSVGQYVQSFGGPAPEPTSADFAAIKIDPNSDFGGGAAAAQSIPVDVAIDLLVRDAAAGKK